MNRRITISGSSLLLPNNRAWEKIKLYGEVSHNDYGDWSGSLINAAIDEIVVQIIFLDDFLGASDKTHFDLDKIFNLYLQLLKKSLIAKTAPTIIAIASCDEIDAVRNSKETSLRQQAQQYLLSSLHELASSNALLYVIDLDRTFAKIGYNCAFDSRNWYFAHCYLSSKGLEVLTDTIYQILNRHFNTAAKVLVLDCDNTIWGGVIGEDGISGIQLGSDGLGQVFKDFQIEAQKLARQGVILCLASKNNEEAVWDVFEHHSGMVLTKDDISASAINWNDKASNLEALSISLGVGLDSFVFWDDNPLERDQMIFQAPKVDTVDVPKDVLSWPKLLRTLSCFAKFQITEDDVKKADQYRSRASFIEAKASTSDTLSYLKSIDLRASAIEINGGTISRAAQLCAKTNQFNMRTVRYSEADIERFCLENSSVCFLVSVSDVYGDHGIVGLVYLKKLSGEVAFLDTMLMSCRVLGRHLESWMLNEIFLRLNKLGFKSLVGEYRETEKNQLVKSFFTDYGFTQIQSDSLNDSAFHNLSITDKSTFFTRKVDEGSLPFLEIYNV